jgi:hypothetical protein
MPLFWKVIVVDPELIPPTLVILISGANDEGVFDPVPVMV